MNVWRLERLAGWETACVVVDWMLVEWGPARWSANPFISLPSMMSSLMRACIVAAPHSPRQPG